MNPETEDLREIPELPEEDFDLFRRAVHSLLSKTFILRGIPKEEILYDFAIRHKPLLDAWFACMEGSLVKDESLGVMAFRNTQDLRLRLGKDETCALLIFRILYEERRREVTLSAFPHITIADFVQRYQGILNTQLKKSRLMEILRKLQTLKLIELPDLDLSDLEEGMIILYPSLALCIDRDSINEILGNLAVKEASEEEESL